MGSSHQSCPLLVYSLVSDGVGLGEKQIMWGEKEVNSHCTLALMNRDNKAKQNSYPRVLSLRIALCHSEFR